MATVIRYVQPGDYEAVISMLDAWWGGRHMAPMLPRLFFSQFAPWTFIAERDGTIAGFLSAFQSQTDPAMAYCHFIGVDPAFRGTGIGEALYHRLFADAQSAGCRNIMAVTSPQNHGSVAFHHRLGFAMLGADHGTADEAVIVDYDGPGQDRVRFCRSLL